MITLNKLIKIVEDYATAHKQLKSYYFGDPWNELSGGQSIHYPMLFSTLQPNRVSGTSDITVLRFYVCDKVKKGLRNQVDVLSDCKLICLDTLTYFKQYTFDELLVLGTEVTLTDFSGDFNDEISGWFFDIEFKAIFEWDACGIPIINPVTI